MISNQLGFVIVISNINTELAGKFQRLSSYYVENFYMIAADV